MYPRSPYRQQFLTDIGARPVRDCEDVGNCDMGNDPECLRGVLHGWSTQLYLCRYEDT